LKRDEMSARAIHGASHTVEYRAWIDMKQRCYYPKFLQHKDYADRGIVVCDRWRDSFPNFLLDMGRKPSRAYSLERVDNDGIYEPTNCVWATRRQQQKNKRLTVLYPFQGEMLCPSEIARLTGLPDRTVRRHLQRAAASPDEAIAKLLAR
jgi:DNA-binding transcriptional ArsR family regulator